MNETTWENAEPSLTKKCQCGEPAIGVIASGLGHKYVCRINAKQAENEGWTVDYDNWRL
jgi:hypothetical protein